MEKEPHRVLESVTSDFMQIALEILSASIIDGFPLEMKGVRNSFLFFFPSPCFFLPLYTILKKQS